MVGFLQKKHQTAIMNNEEEEGFFNFILNEISKISNLKKISLKHKLFNIVIKYRGTINNVNGQVNNPVIFENVDDFAAQDIEFLKNLCKMISGIAHHKKILLKHDIITVMHRFASENT